MPTISSINYNGTDYEIKDAFAREQLEDTIPRVNTINTIIDGNVIEPNYPSAAIFLSSGTLDITDPTAHYPTSSIYDATFISCVPGDKFTINAQGGTAARPYCFIKNDGSRITSTLGAAGIVENLFITAPAEAAYLAINNNKNFKKVCFYGFVYNYNDFLNDTRLFNLYDREDIEEKLLQLHWSKTDGSDSAAWENFTLLHFSDIHADQAGLNRIVEFKNTFSDYITDVIHTGDTVESNINNINIFPTISGAETILNTIGNHDAKTTVTGTGHWGATETETFNKIIAPNYQSWNINNNTELNSSLSNSAALATKCYYYKDYDNSNIRLIVLDPMHIYTGAAQLPSTTTTMPKVSTTAELENDPQLIWFKEVLADALINNKHIIVACHVLLRVGNDLIPIHSGFNNSFNCLPKTDGTLPWNTTATAFPYGITDFNPTDGDGKRAGYCKAVTDFVDAGGLVVCWIAGHRHLDMLGFVLSPQQHKILNISITTQRSLTNRTKEIRKTNTKTQDAFNIYGVNEKLKLLKVMRVGQHYNGAMQKIDTFCWKYDTGELLYTS